MFWLILAVGSCWHTRVCRPDKPYPHPDSSTDGLAAVPVSGVVEDSNEMSGSETNQTQHELSWIHESFRFVSIVLAWFCMMVLDMCLFCCIVGATMCNCSVAGSIHFRHWRVLVGGFNMFQLVFIPPLFGMKFPWIKKKRHILQGVELKHIETTSQWLREESWGLQEKAKAALRAVMFHEPPQAL